MGPRRSYSFENDAETTPLLKQESFTCKDEKIATTISSKRNEAEEASSSRKVTVLVCCVILHLLSGGIGYALGVIYVELIRVFHSPRTEAALVQTVFMGVMVAGGLVFTRVITKFGTGPCVAVGSTVACAGFVVSSLAENVPMIIVFTGIVAGIGMCVCYLCAFITVGWLFHSGAGAPLALLTVGIGVGQIIFPYVYDSLITEYGWRGTFLFVGAITLHGVPIGVLFYTSRRFFKISSDSSVGRHSGGGTSLTPNTCRENNTRKDVSMFDVSLFKDPIVVLFLLNALLFSATGNTELWFIVDIMVLRGFTRDVGSLMLTIAGVGNCVGRVGGAVFKVYMRFPAVSHWIYTIPIVAGCHAIVLLRTDYWSTVCAMLIYGIFFGITASVSPAVMFEAAGLERYPRAVAMMNLCQGLGNTMGGLFGGFINDVTHTYDLMFVIAIAVSLYITLATILIAFCMHRSKRRDYSVLKGSDFSS